MSSRALLLAAVPIAGLLAGFINTLAGSGSLLTLPVLIFLGLPANVANGTNRVGVIFQNAVAVATFRRHGALTRNAWRLVAPSVVGSVLGAALAVDLDAALLRRIIGVLMLVLVAVMLVKPERWLTASAGAPRARPWLEMPLFFAIGAYGGFIQAGVGIFLLAGLVLGAGFGLVQANAIKNLIVLVLSAAAIVVFVLNDQVAWSLGLLLALGQAAGAWLAARLALRRGARFVRVVVMAVVAVSAVALFAGVGL